MTTRQLITTSLLLILTLRFTTFAVDEQSVTDVSNQSAKVEIEEEISHVKQPVEDEQAKPSESKPLKEIEIEQLQVTSRINGNDLGMTLDFEAKATRLSHRRMLLVQGDVVLDTFNRPESGCKLDYDRTQKAYYITLPKQGSYSLHPSFVAKSQIDKTSFWREVELQVPTGRVRRIQLVSDRPDLEIQLPGAMRIQRQVEQGQLTITAILARNKPFIVRWKPQVELADAKLVLSSQANTIVDVRAAQLHLDSLFDFQITQGKLETLAFEIPEDLSITAIDGSYIRNWTIADPNERARKLVVNLSQPQEKYYRLRISAEVGIDKLPAKITVPVIEPTGGIRASGHLGIGTNSALQLVVSQSIGLTQIDTAAFPRVHIDTPQDRPVPEGKAFFYTYAGSRYLLQLTVDNIVPSYDVSERFVTTIKEDDLMVDAELELDVRDAPIRQLDIRVGPGIVVASVSGDHVEDYRLSEEAKGNEGTTVHALFAKPLTGRTLIRLRLELGHGPLEQLQTLRALEVLGAKTHRGYVVVAAEAGIEINDPEVANLRQVHTASVPMRVAQAQFAYRFREPNWNLSFLARSKPAGIRAEVFHLQSVGESIAYGSAAINYIITGSPVDELHFSLPEDMENVEFVGSDVRRWTQQDGIWIVTLARKVIGDYNLAVTYTQPYGSNQTIQLGTLQCQDVQTQTGYVVVTSHLDLKLQIARPSNSDIEGLLPIAIDELPVDYRLLTSSPILASYKYVSDPHVALLSIDPYPRSGLLPVILDIISHQTRLAVGEDGQVESVTTVRYKVKNTTGQFLSLNMPSQANVWSVFSIDQKNGRPVKTRLATSYDADSEQLLVPLPRKVNPNDPSTIELEYGQIHDTKGWLRRRLDLTAPHGIIPVTYTEWHVNVPDEWAIFATSGNMQTQASQTATAGLAAVFRQVGRFWSRSIQRWASFPVIWAAGIGVVISIILCAVFFRRWLPNLILAVLLVMFLWAGVTAGLCGPITQSASFTSLQFSQAVNADPDQAIQVGVELVPAWRRNITFPKIVVVSIIAALAVIFSFFRRQISLWPIAVILASALYLAAQFPAAWPLLKALMTWGAPALLTAWCVFIAFKKHHHRLSLPVSTAAAPILLIVGLLSVISGCTTVGPGGPLPDQASKIEKIECNLTAGADSMEIEYKLRISADAPSSLELLKGSAVLISSPEPKEHVKIATANDWHTIVVDRAGTYEIEAVFLVPLPQSNGQGCRGHFNLPLPMALTNNVRLTIPDTNVLIHSPEAIQLTHRIEGKQAIAEGMFVPGQPAVFSWHPKERQASQEETRFYARNVALAHITSGLVEVFHKVHLQIAQGQIDSLKLHIADGETVTSVNAPNLGSWRFDPVTQEVEVRLTQPVTGVYDITLVIQSASSSMPYNIRLEPMVVDDALEQHSIIGLAADASVYTQLNKHPTAMNTRDYIRDSAELIKMVKGLSSEQVTQAFRFDSAASAITGKVLAVKSELRSREIARFNAEDDRLVYNSQWSIDITKAGRFDILLHIPEGYDIDTLVSEAVSHWDESGQGKDRTVRVHFKGKLTGSIQLKLALSQPVAQMPQRLTVPRVTLADALKHTGHLVIGSEQGVRLSVAHRQGVSEMNPAELGETGQDLLAFHLLRPDWQLDLQTELVQPRVTVQSLHIAKVTDGLVRHDHYVRYKLFHAGTKTFELSLPTDATGVTITGPRIARREQVSPGNWRVELASKVYDQPYLMRLTYETQYNQTEGNVTLKPVRCQGIDLQQGHVAVFATDRMELSTPSMDGTMRPAEARNIPKHFGAGDLSAAAMCYYSASPDSVLTVKAMRHSAAEQIGADVRQTQLATIITPSGQAIHQVSMRLGVGTRRHLQVILPNDGIIWSLSVDGQATQPSIRNDVQGQDVLRVPLPQQTSQDVILDMVYVAEISSVDDWSGDHNLLGARFDLPLKNISWQVYVPENFNYDHFGGTLTINKNAPASQLPHRYNLQSYEQQVIRMNVKNDQVAQQQLELSRKLAEQGRQADARRALSIGYNFSRGNKALNEDIRVDLDNLLKQQAKMGLVNARGRLRQQVSGTANAADNELINVEGKNITFSQQQAERMESSLAKADSENLELITQRIIQTQAAAEGSVAQLQITMPYSGKVLHFDCPLQVKPYAPMAVTFRAERKRIRQFDAGIYYGLGLFVILLLIGTVIRLMYRRWDQLQQWLTPLPRPVQSNESETPNNPDDTGDQISAEELI
ncbi:MAG: sulfite exporter TauE/SafE family protein [Planctomycetota bacterium]|jgi:hypothetical protein